MKKFLTHLLEGPAVSGLTEKQSTKLGNIFVNLHNAATIEYSKLYLSMELTPQWQNAAFKQLGRSDAEMVALTLRRLSRTQLLQHNMDFSGYKIEKPKTTWYGYKPYFDTGWDVKTGRANALDPRQGELERKVNAIHNEYTQRWHAAVEQEVSVPK